MYKVCFNPGCKAVNSESWRKGWRIQHGEEVDLCDRCASAFEEQKFCEIFHSDSDGWRCCQTCQKLLHCGCIISVHTIILLDVGGVQCMECFRKNHTKCVPFFQTASPALPSSLILPFHVPERLKNSSTKNSNQDAAHSVHGQWPTPSTFWPTYISRKPVYETDKTNNIEKLMSGGPDFVTVKREHEPANAKRGFTGQVCSNNTSSGKFEASTSSYLSMQRQSSSLKEDLSPLKTPLPISSKQHFSSQLNGTDSLLEVQDQICRGKTQGDGRERDQLLPQYWTRITDQESKKISRDSNSAITPLFEKILSASDAGRIGRLVLPKKCAEEYFPPICHPEGQPLRVQDAAGKEWVFQFRFWPNNNSRMYVLEGVSACIQSMQLQAGDTVTFSRIDPEGKLLMGFRKASSMPSEQDDEANKWQKGFPTGGEVNSSNNKLGEVVPNRRKSNILGSKTKRLQIENEESVQIKITWEEAQELLRPPPNCVPSVVVIEGHEFEEFEEAPILGKSAIFTSDYTGSSCSSDQEINTDKLETMFISNKATPERDQDKAGAVAVEALEGLDLAMLVKKRPTSPSQITTKHTRHRDGCTCSVCIQPPSGKGPKHNQSCTCNVCLAIRRHFQILTSWHEKHQFQEEAKLIEKQLQIDPENQKKMLKEVSSNNKRLIHPSQVEDDCEHPKPIFHSRIKCQIDLNIYPEQEEEVSPLSDRGDVLRLLQDATERCLQQQRLDAVNKTEPSINSTSR